MRRTEINRRTHLTVARARGLRQALTHPERLLWNALRNRTRLGLKFRRQHPIPPYIVDFACVELRLAIEVDGPSHDAVNEMETTRTRSLEAEGWMLLRVSNHDVLDGLEGVVWLIERAARERGWDGAAVERG